MMAMVVIVVIVIVVAVSVAVPASRGGRAMCVSMHKLLV